jgi:hypothetical protein
VLPCHVAVVAALLLLSHGAACAQDTLVVSAWSPSLGMDEELGRVEVPMTDIRAAVQVC